MKRINKGFKFKKLTSCLSAIALATAAIGCAPDFDPFNLVDKPRILAVQADPPELKPGERAQLRALVYAPDQAEVSYHWQWCPFTTGPT